MSKVLITSDTHVHAHKHSSERLKHCLDALDWVFKTAADREVETILFLGDLFHERQKIDVLTYQRVFEIFEKYIGKTVKNIYLLLGNHDLWHLDKWDVSSVFPLRSIPGVVVIDKPCTLSIEDHDISFLPYTHNPSEDLIKINNDFNHKILCGHVAIDGALWHVMHKIHSEVLVEHDGDMHKVDANIFNGWDQVFLGHYHCQQKLGPKVEYVGSPLQLSFGEAFQTKHIVLLDLDTYEKEYIRNDFSPKHFIIRQNDIEKYDLNGHFVKIMVDNIGKSDIAEMHHDLKGRFDFGSLEIIQDDAAPNVDVNMVEDAKEILTKHEDMLQKYVNTQDDWGQIIGLNKEKLLKIGQKICAAIPN